MYNALQALSGWVVWFFSPSGLKFRTKRWMHSPKFSEHLLYYPQLVASELLPFGVPAGWAWRNFECGSKRVHLLSITCHASRTVFQPASFLEIRVEGVTVLSPFCHAALQSSAKRTTSRRRTRTTFWSMSGCWGTLCLGWAGVQTI